MESMAHTDEYDSEALDAALGDLAEAANNARVAFIMQDEDIGRHSFNLAIGAMFKAVHQLSLLNRK